MIADVLGIKLSVEKGKDRVEVKEGVLLKDYGLEGDAYSGSGSREVCLMSVMTKKTLSQYSEGLCMARFVPSILIDLDPQTVSVGSVLKLGEAEVLITNKGKRCFPECKIIHQKRTCPLVTESMFGKVIKSGMIKVK